VADLIEADAPVRRSALLEDQNPTGGEKVRRKRAMKPAPRLLLNCAFLAIVFADIVLAQTKGLKAEKHIWSGQSGNFSLIWTTKKIEAHRIGSSSALAAFTLKSFDVARPIEGYYSRDEFALVSAVGSLVSIQYDNYCECGGAHPTLDRNIIAYDLDDERRGARRPARLTDYFRAEDILQALLADSFIRRALEVSKNRQPATLDELIKAVALQGVEAADCEFSVQDDLLSRFAFHHLEDDQVAVRLGVSHHSEFCRGQMVQLGILLPIPEKLRDSLNSAVSGRSGFLMAGQGKFSRDSKTIFEHRPKRLLHER
jgi:hypothetical protein